MEIRSNFVKEEIKKTEWKNREYIKHLMDIEKFATDGYCSTGAGYIRMILKEKYPEQWKSIWLELNPEGYRKNLEWQKKEAERARKEDEQLKKEEKLELEKERLEWREMGGS